MTGYARLSAWLAAFLLAWFAFALAGRGLTSLPEGVFQRPFGIALTAWYLATALTVRGLAHSRQRPAGAALVPGQGSRQGSAGRAAPARAGRGCCG